MTRQEELYAAADTLAERACDWHHAAVRSSDQAAADDLHADAFALEDAALLLVERADAHG